MGISVRVAQSGPGSALGGRSRAGVPGAAAGGPGRRWSFRGSGSGTTCAGPPAGPTRPLGLGGTGEAPQQACTSGSRPCGRRAGSPCGPLGAGDAGELFSPGRCPRPPVAGSRLPRAGGLAKPPPADGGCHVRLPEGPQAIRGLGLGGLGPSGRAAVFASVRSSLGPLHLDLQAAARPAQQVADAQVYTVVASGTTTMLDCPSNSRPRLQADLGVALALPLQLTCSPRFNHPRSAVKLHTTGGGTCSGASPRTPPNCARHPGGVGGGESVAGVLQGVTVTRSCRPAPAAGSRRTLALPAHSHRSTTGSPAAPPGSWRRRSRPGGLARGRPGSTFTTASPRRAPPGPGSETI